MLLACLVSRDVRSVATTTSESVLLVWLDTMLTQLVDVLRVLSSAPHAAPWDVLPVNRDTSLLPTSLAPSHAEAPAPVACPEILRLALPAHTDTFHLLVPSRAVCLI